MQYRKLVVGFSEYDKKRVNNCLAKIFPHLNMDKSVVVGGLAIRYHLVNSGLDYPSKKFNDLDLMVEEASVVKLSITKDFLIYHYHPQKGNNFYIVVVDPVNKIKVDIFDYDPPPENLKKVRFDLFKVKIRGIEDQLVKTVFDIQRISEKFKVDPKQFMNTKLLIQIANFKKADLMWKKRRYINYPNSIKDAIDRAFLIAKQHPDWVSEKPFRKPKPYHCLECKSTKNFPITQMSEIYKILGYVE